MSAKGESADHLIEISECRNAGLFRRFSGRKSDVFHSVSLIRDDKEIGVKWTARQGQTYLVSFESNSVVDENNNNEDEVYSAEETVYVYPDLIHVIAGQFTRNGKLIKGRFGYIAELKYCDGIPYPVVEVINPDVNYICDISTSLSMGKFPLLRDPFEHKRVYVAKSRVSPLAGEGLFAKQDLEAGSLVALFNGFRIRQADGTAQAKFSDYKISLTREIALDIIGKFVNLSNYRATLAHKACHSFAPNSQFLDLYHPRFGQIMCIAAKTDIKRGEEVLVSYNYGLHLAPEWYRHAYFEHLRNVENKSEEFLYQTAAKIAKLHGVKIKVPPPAPDSPRFVPCGVCGDHVGTDLFSVQCEKCLNWIHVGCMREESRERIIEMVDAKIEFTWNCQSCSPTS